MVSDIKGKKSQLGRLKQDSFIAADSERDLGSPSNETQCRQSQRDRLRL